jgi:hypothetical protein
MVVNQGLVELLHGLSGLTDAVHKHLHRRRQSFARRGVGQRGIIQKVVNIAQAGRRGQVDFGKQGGVNALFFQYSGLPLRGAVSVFTDISIFPVNPLNNARRLFRGQRAHFVA